MARVPRTDSRRKHEGLSVVFGRRARGLERLGGSRTRSDRPEVHFVLHSRAAPGIGITLKPHSVGDISFVRGKMTV